MFNSLFSAPKSRLSTSDFKSALFNKEIHILNEDQIVSDICDIVPELHTSWPLACWFSAVKKCSAASLLNWNKISTSKISLEYILVGIQVDARYANVVPGPYETWGYGQGVVVRVHRLLRPRSVRQRRPQSVPQSGVLNKRSVEQLKTNEVTRTHVRLHG